MYYEKPPIEDFLMHYGRGHLDGGNSGRYPWGSGEEPFQHDANFLSRVKELEDQNFTYYDKETGETLTGEIAIARYCGFKSTKELRNAKKFAKDLEYMDKINRARSLTEQGYGPTEVARKMGLPNESSVRALLKPSKEENTKKAMATAEFIADRLEEKLKKDPKAMIDIGTDVERELNVSRTMLDNAIYILKQEGYKNYVGRKPQLTDTTGKRMTTYSVLAGPDSEPKDFYSEGHLYSLVDYISRDNGETYEKKFEYPESMDSKRLMIRYAEDGGIDQDGVIELRRGVEDLSLGESNYSQVRIMVDNNLYLKGMAVYSEDKNFPPGVDVIFNTNKKRGTALEDVLKKCKIDKSTGEIDKTNPFGSAIKPQSEGGQYHYIGKDGKEHLGLINKRADEGDWDDWKDTLSAQFLSKQKEELISRQLNESIQAKKDEYNDILNLNNNVVKQHFLESFADDCDSAAVHLKAAALPRQKFRVILPISSLKDDEIYAPDYNNGEKVALVRYPHGGTFEIPILTVNNKNAEGDFRITKNSQDAVGINAHVAGRLSGADFDGDTVMVVPIGNGIDITSTPPLKGLEGFDPKTEYGTTKKEINGEDHYFNSSGVEIQVMNNTQIQMGTISNLISDMTIKGATEDELARAVRHSMVVIDAEKHKLDYRSSEQVNQINELKKKYQKQFDENGKEIKGKHGASTLISRAKSKQSVERRQGQPKINIKGTPQYDPTRPEGALIFKKASDSKLYYRVIKVPNEDKDSKNKTRDADVYERKDGTLYYMYGHGKDRKAIDITDPSKIIVRTRMEDSTKMEETDDARTLISEYNHPKEILYADYANTMKAMANEARKTLYFTKGVEYNAAAAKVYKKEVDELKRAIDISMKNSPRERMAQSIANDRAQVKIKSDYGLSKDDKKKIKQRELEQAREELGAKRIPIDISQKQWEAIQAGAVRATTLKQVLKYADMDKVRELATPKDTKTLSDAQKTRIQAMANSGRTNAEIAEAMGVSASTVSSVING